MHISVQFLLGLTLPLFLSPPSLTLALIAGTPQPEARITIRLFNYTEVAGEDIQQAKNVAAEIFDQIEVKTRWLHCFPPVADAPIDPDCEKPSLASAIYLRLAEQSTDPEVFQCGLALPAEQGAFSKHAIVFYRCVVALVAERRSTRVAILGHFIAHEIGHLLLGLGSHSSEGIMRYPWGRAEIESADKGWLRFTPQQGERIRAQVRARNRTDDATTSK